MKFHLVPQNNNLRDVVPQQRTRTSYLSTCKTIANRYRPFSSLQKRGYYFFAKTTCVLGMYKLARAPIQKVLGKY
jgi:hypothetical protein